MNSQRTTEPALNPELPIIDTHHHLYDRVSEAEARIAGGRRRYLIDEMLEDMNCGHDIIATVYVDATTMYRKEGPEEFRVIGETEFANGQAAMSASGLYGPSRIACAIVGTTDFRLGDRVKGVLEAHVAAGNGRFRGIRQTGAWDEDASIFGGMFKNVAGLYLGSEFRRGFAHLAPMGLSFDAFVLPPQIPNVTDLARSFPNTTIILDHVGGPVGIGRYKGQRQAMFGSWKKNVQELSKCPNVMMKLGGLGSFLGGFSSYNAQPAVSSAVLAEEWKPYIESSIEAFGVERCMFESNYPVDYGSGAYGTIWNAFKRITAGYSPGEQMTLFAGTAADVYRLKVRQLVAA